MQYKSPFGQIPRHWTVARLRDLTSKIGSGATPRGGEKAYLQKRQNYALIRSQSVHDRYFDTSSVSFIADDQAHSLRNAEVRDGDILLNITGDGVTFGRSTIVPNCVLPACVNQHVAIVRPVPTLVDAQYLMSFLASPEAKSYIEGFNAGGSRRAITKGHIESFEIPLPPLAEQKAIGSILSSLDDKIELNRRMNETLEAMAQAIFRDWFVDFGPTRRKLDGATDPVTIMGGLVQDTERAQALAELFPAALGDDGLPEGWAHRPFGSLLSDTIGGDWGKDTSEGESAHLVAIIRGTDFPEVEAGGVGKVPTRYTTAKKAARRKLLPSDILIEVSGGSPTQPTGRSIFITQSVLDRFNSDVVCASFCRRFRAISHDSAVLAFEHLRNLYSEGGTWEYQNQSTGISNFQTTHFLEAEKVVFPGEELMEHFASLSGPMIEARYRNESMTLAATRDLLLPKLMSGEVRIQEAQEVLEAAQ